jgi:hypothetical protein
MASSQGLSATTTTLFTSNNNNKEESSIAMLVDQVTKAVKSMPEGDVLLVGPIQSGGTARDGKTIVDTAAALNIAVGGKRGGGVMSVLLDGPRQGLLLEEGGYSTCELLWYSRL